jgi:hypothetical protein
MHAALNPEGVVLVNLLASPEGVASRFYRALHATFQTRFASVETYAVADPVDRHLWQNLILAAGSKPPTGLPEDPALQRMLAHALPPPGGTIAPFTDEYAPVDRYIGELSLRTATR